MWLWSAEYLISKEKLIKNKIIYTKWDNPDKVLSFYRKKIQNNKEEMRKKRNLWKAFDIASQKILILNWSEKKNNDSYIKNIYCILNEEEKNQGIINMVLSFSIEKKEDSNENNNEFHIPKITLYTTYATWISTTLLIKPDIEIRTDRAQNQKEFKLYWFYISSITENSDWSLVNSNNNNNEFVEDVNFLKQKLSIIKTKTSEIKKQQNKEKREENKETRKENRNLKKEDIQKKIDTFLKTNKKEITNKENTYEKQEIKNALLKLKNEIKKDKHTINIDEALEEQINIMDDIINDTMDDNQIGQE